MKLEARIPAGDLAQKWDNHRFASKLVNPANRRKFTVIVVGTGLAGASASATLAEQGYQVKTFCIQDSPRRAHSIAAQGGINAAKNYQNDGDSVLPAVLRHDQGRRFPGPRGQCLPPGPGQQQHHRSVRRPGSALCPRIRRHPRQPLLRRRPGVANLLRPRPDRSATAARGLQRPVTPDPRGRVTMYHPPRDDGSRRG